MVWFSKDLARSVTVSMCALILIFLLAACGGHTDSTSTNNHSSSLTNPVHHVLAPTATKSVLLKAKPAYSWVETCVKRWKPSIRRKRHTSPESGGW
jgi:ABC-type uncharacterized transport system auxiliary subunit